MRAASGHRRAMQHSLGLAQAKRRNQPLLRMLQFTCHLTCHQRADLVQSLMLSGEVNRVAVANAIACRNEDEMSAKSAVLTMPCGSNTLLLSPGGVAERPNAPVLKTGRPARVS